jgi:DNA-binding IclR family transcriptional regulator
MLMRGAAAYLVSAGRFVPTDAMSIAGARIADNAYREVLTVIRSQASDVTLKATAESFRVPAVDRALNVIELLASSERGLTVSEIKRKLGLPKSSAHCLVNTLATRGYVRRALDGNHYFLGPSISSLPSVNAAELELRTGSLRFLKEFTLQFGLTTIIAVLRGAQAVIIARVKSPHDSGGGEWIGRHVDLHCSALGKALIAYLSNEELERLLSGRELLHYTPNTISSMDELKVSLAVVRAQGYAVNYGEEVISTRAVAAPIFDKPGSVAAAVCARVTANQSAQFGGFERLGKELIGLARNISARLTGY